MVWIIMDCPAQGKCLVIQYVRQLLKTQEQEYRYGKDQLVLSPSYLHELFFLQYYRPPATRFKSCDKPRERCDELGKFVISV